LSALSQAASNYRPISETPTSPPLSMPTTLSPTTSYNSFSQFSPNTGSNLIMSSTPFTTPATVPTTKTMASIERGNIFNDVLKTISRAELEQLHREVGELLAKPGPNVGTGPPITSCVLVIQRLMIENN